jgi:prolyl oligopeptidase
MKRFTILFVTLVVILVSCQQGMQYPETRKTEQSDEYFGTMVDDPYRWLEDDNSEETRAWVVAQNEVTGAYLEKIPFREKINKRLTEVWNYPRVSAPFKEGGHYFFSKNDGLQNQSVYYIQDDLDDEPREFLDPNKLSEDGTVALSGFAPSKDGKYVGFSIARSGSDWNEFYVKDVTTGEDLEDHLKWIKFSGMSWYDNGFFYSRFPEPVEGDALKGRNLNNRLYYHVLGTPQSDDRLIYEDAENPEYMFNGGVTEDNRYLVISATESTSGNAFYFKDLTIPGSEIIRVVESFDNDYYVLDHKDGYFYVMTNYDAPNYRVVKIDVNDVSREKWTDFVPEKEDEVLKGFSMVGGKVFVTYEKDAHSEVDVLDLDGEFLYQVEFPTIGSAYGFGGKMEDEFTFYTFTSYTYPSVIYKYDIESNTSEIHHRSEIDFAIEEYQTKQVFYESKDGTTVPMFIVHKKDLELNGKNPAWLYGYGGFNISLTPGFDVRRLVWLENGGIYAVANLRGGGEYGEKWHEAGTKMNKQNVFDDFIAAANFLIDENYTSSEMLVCQGGSNGGLLVGAVINQAPDLFKVAFPQVGVMDMLRYHKFTIGKFWATDYGTSEDSKEMFEYLYNYSPLHNISSDEAYPAVMITTADHDDRVVPAHSFKYAATLQEKQSGKSPVLIRIETKAGHGGGMPTSKRIEALTDLYAFAFKNLGIEPIY